MSTWGQNTPLPPGWEAKYDPTSKRYFFINHATKETTWTDPRTSYQQAYQQPNVSNYAQQQQQQQQLQQQRQLQQQQQQLQQQQQRQLQQQQLQQQQLQQQQAAAHALVAQQAASHSTRNEEEEETSLNIDSIMGDLVSNSEKNRVLQSIKTKIDLIGVSDDLIMTTLDASSFDEAMAISVFESMGFKKHGAAPSVTNTNRTNNRWEVGTSSRPARPKPAASTTSSSRPKPSSSSTSTRATSSSSTTTTSQPSTSSIKVTDLDIILADMQSLDESLEPVERPASSVSKPASKKPSATSSSLSSSVARVKPSKNTSITSLLNKSSDHLRAKSPNRKSPAPKKSKVKVKGAKAATIKTTAPSVMSELKSYEMVTKLQTEGADPSLAFGSFADELRNGRLQAVGRDSSLAVGSQRQHREGSQARQLKMGSSGCQGSDASLVIGANNLLAMGPRRGMGVAV